MMSTSSPRSLSQMAIVRTSRAASITGLDSATDGARPRYEMFPSGRQRAAGSRHAVEVVVDEDRRWCGGGVVGGHVVEQAVESVLRVGVRAQDRLQQQVLDAVEVCRAAQEQRLPAAAAQLRRQSGHVVQRAVQRGFGVRALLERLGQQSLLDLFEL